MITDDLAAGENVARFPDKAQSNCINAFFEAHKDILAIFRRQRIDVNIRSRKIDAFVGSE